MANFYDDWNLSITGWDDGTARIDILLPHNSPQEVAIWTTKEQVQPIANLLDKLLSALTGTKEGLLNGRDTTDTIGRPKPLQQPGLQPDSENPSS